MTKGICRLELLLTELGLLPLQVFWWPQTLQCWSGLAGLPIGCFYHTVCLDNLTDAFQEGACNMANLVIHWQHVCIQWLLICLVCMVLDVDGLVAALTPRLQGTGSGSQYCPRAAPTQGVASSTSGLSLTAHVGGNVSFLFLGGACSDFCRLGWTVMACRLLLAVWLVLAMWTGSVWLATVVLLAMRNI